MNQTLKSIPFQVRLPVRVAMEVVLQGIRIRLGRSLVTITGVICGIAFLMSILTGQIIKLGVQAEDDIRSEVSRMENFLLADAGGLAGRPVSLWLAGALKEGEHRFLMQQAKVGGVRYQVDSETAAVAPLPLRPYTETVERSALFPAGGVLLASGEGTAELPDWIRPSEGPRRVLAISGSGITVPAWEGVDVVSLARELLPEDLATQAATARKERFRSVWIVVISLLVTVIGIANAMLMSVTERFREIGTMKCLGALSAFIRRVFLLESSLMGFFGGACGSLGGMLFSLAVYGVTYGPALVISSVAASSGRLALYFAGSLLAGVILSVIAAIYPAGVASRMVPADALRSNV
jgi:hypothetical protein